MRMRLRNYFGDLIAVGHVQRQRQDGVAERVGKGRDVGQLSRGCDDLVAPLESIFSPDAAKTARGARDKPDFFGHIIAFSI